LYESAGLIPGSDPSIGDKKCGAYDTEIALFYTGGGRVQPGRGPETAGGGQEDEAPGIVNLDRG
jgi:hypothetical protein